MTENRIGSSCWFREYIRRGGTYTEWKPGVIRLWTTDHIEYDNGPGPFPVGVIEDSTTLAMKSIPVQDITFAAIPGE